MRRWSWTAFVVGVAGQFTFPPSAELLTIAPYATLDIPGDAVAQENGATMVVSVARDAKREATLQFFEDRRLTPVVTFRLGPEPVNAPKPRLAVQGPSVMVTTFGGNLGGELTGFRRNSGIWSSVPVARLPAPEDRGFRRLQSNPTVRDAVGCGGTVSDTIADRGGSHAYAFTALPMDDQFYRFATCGSDFDTRIDVFDRNADGSFGNSRAGCDDCGNCAPQTDRDAILPEGEYIIVVSGVNNARGNYLLTVTCGRETMPPSAAPTWRPSIAPSTFTGAVIMDTAFARNGDRLVIAADYRDDPLTQVEGIYSLGFDDSDGWGVDASAAIATVPGDRLELGTRISVSADLVAVGSPWTPADDRFGQVMLLSLATGAFEVVEQFFPPPAVARTNLEFGRGVGLSDELLLVAANGEAFPDGQIFVYDVAAGGTEPITTLTPARASGPGHVFNLGATIRVEPTFTSISAFAALDASDSSGGFVYIYEPCPAERLCQAAVIEDFTRSDPVDRAFDASSNGFAALASLNVVELYNLSNPSGMPITSAPTPAPSGSPTERVVVELLSVQATPSGARIEVELNTDADLTDFGVDSFPCSNVFTGDALRSERCCFETPRRLSLVLEGTSILSPGDALALVPSALSSAPQPITVSLDPSSRSLPIAAPAPPAAPIVRFSHPAEASPCSSSFRIDASESRNNGGRDFTSYEWSIAMLNGVAPTTVIDAAAAETGDTLVLSTADLSVGDVYNVTLVLRNFVGGVGTASTTFTAVGPEASVLEIFGATIVELPPGRERSFSGGFLQRCDGAAPDLSDYNPKWNMIRVTPGDEGVVREVVRLPTATDQSLLVVPPFTFASANATFEIEYTVVTAPGVVPAEGARAVITVVPMPEPLRPVIEGCNVTIGPGVHTIDAAQSFDPNVGSRGSAVAEAAVVTSIAFARGGDASSCASSPALTTPESGLVIFEAGAHAGCDLSFSVRHMATDPRVPGVSYTCTIRVNEVVGPGLRVLPLQSSESAAGDDAAVLADVTATPTRSISTTWTVTAGVLARGASLEAASASAVTSTIPALPVAGVDVASNLVVLGAFLAPGVTYTLELSAAFAGTSTGGPTATTAASVTFTVNRAPTSGSLNVSPPSGTWSTLFELDAPDWTDDPGDLPLLYAFTVDPQPATPTSQLLLLNPSRPSARRIREATLPAGLGVNAFEVLVRVEVVDLVGATAIPAPFRTVVTPADDGTAAAEATLAGTGVRPVEATDVIIRSILGAAALLQGAGDSWGVGGAVGLEVLERVSAFLATRDLTLGTLRAQVGVMRLLSQPPPSAAISRGLIALAEDITRTVDQLETAAGPDVVVVSEETLTGLTEGIGGGVSSGDFEGTLDLVESAVDVIERLRALRAASLVAGGPVEAVDTTEVRLNSRLRTFDPAGSGIEVEPVGAGLGVVVDAESLAGAGVNAFDDFLFSVTDFPAALHEGFGIVPGTGGGSPEALVGEASQLMSGVQRLSVGVSEDGAGRELTEAGRVNVTFALGSVDPQREAQCVDITRNDPAGVNCTSRLVCARFAAAEEAFRVLDECEAVVNEATTQVTCACDFGSLDKRRLVESVPDDDGSFADVSTSDTVVVDFGTLLVSSGVTFQSTFADLDEDARPQPIVFAALLLFLVVWLLFTALAKEFDRREMEDSVTAARRSAAIFDDWAKDRGLGVKFLEKLKPRVCSMEDVALLRLQSRQEMQRLALECQLSDSEVDALGRALEEPVTPYMSMLHPEATAGAPAGKVSAYRSVTTSDVLDGKLWYGLLLATPGGLRSFQDTSTFSRIAGALRQKHDFYDALSLHSGLNPTRMVRVLTFFANLGSALLMNAVVFQVIYPSDEEFCAERNGDREACTSPASMLNARESRCYFEMPEGNCIPTQPEMGSRDLILTTAFALLFVAPAAIAFRWLVERFLEESPLASVRLAGQQRLRRKDRLAQSEDKRAAVLADAEWRYLMDHPEHQPRAFQRLWPRCLRSFVLRRRVAAAAREAAELETELDAEYSTWASQRAAQILSEESLRQVVFQHKVFVTKLAVRDSLPAVKRLVFRRYVRLSGTGAPKPRWLRRLLIGFLVLYIVFCCAYVAAFGLSVSDETAQTWAVSVILAELLTAVLLVVMRIVVLNVVLPSLVRPDVSIERVLFKMPHYAAAALLSRQRHDLLPGLSLLLDARFISRPARSVLPTPASGAHLGSASRQSLTGFSIGTPPHEDLAPTSRESQFTRGAFELLGESECSLLESEDEEGEGDTRRASAQLRELRSLESSSTDPRHGRGRRRSPSSLLSPRISRSPASEDKSDDTFSHSSGRRRSAAMLPPPSFASAEAGARSSTSLSSAGDAAGDREEKGEREPKRRPMRISDMGAMRLAPPSFASPVSSFLGAESESKIDTRSVAATATDGGPESLMSPRSAERRSVFGKKRRELYGDLPLTSVVSLYSYDGGRSIADVGAYDNAISYQSGGIGSSQSVRPNSSVPSDVESLVSETGTRISPAEGATMGGITEVGWELRRRSCVARWCTRFILLLFAVVLIFPEPLQELLLEEGIPVGTAVLLLVALDLDLDDERLEAGVMIAFITAVLLSSVLLLFTVQRAIDANVTRVSSLGPADQDGGDASSEQPSARRRGTWRRTRLEVRTDDDSSAGERGSGKKPIRILSPREAVGFKRKKRTRSRFTVSI